jgi:hypothetical protein
MWIRCWGIDNLWGVLVFGQPERSVCWQMSGPVLGCRLMSECMKLILTEVTGDGGGVDSHRVACSFLNFALIFTAQHSIFMDGTHVLQKHLNEVVGFCSSNCIGNKSTFFFFNTGCERCRGRVTSHARTEQEIEALPLQVRTFTDRCQ